VLLTGMSMPGPVPTGDVVMMTMTCLNDCKCSEQGPTGICIDSPATGGGTDATCKRNCICYQNPTHGWLCQLESP
jgi:hypothetical protein